MDVDKLLNFEVLLFLDCWTRMIIQIYLPVFTLTVSLQRRTGVKDSEISDFERKVIYWLCFLCHLLPVVPLFAITTKAYVQVTDVEAAIKGLMDGTIKPENCKVEGIDTDEEILQKKVRANSWNNRIGTFL